MFVETRDSQEDYNSGSHGTSVTNERDHEMDDDEGGTPTTPPGQLKCSICQSTFRRPEHLRRHFRSHTKEKPFKCGHCGRCFSRTDTLHRHEVSHHAQGPDGERERVYRINVSTFRACIKCAVARVRCSGGTPCDRCQTKTLECEYPKERKSKIRAMREASQNSAAAEARAQAQQQEMRQGTPHDQSLPGDIRMETEPSPLPTEHIQSQFTGFENSNISPIGTIHTPPVDFSRQSASIVNQGIPHIGNSVIAATNLESPAHSPIDPSFPNIGPPLYATPSTHNFAVPPSVRSESASDKYGYTSGNTHPGISNTSMSMALSNPTSNPIQMNFDPNLFDQSVLSAINWLPSGLFDGSSDDMELVSGAPPPSLPNAWSADSHLRSMWLPTGDGDQISSSRIPGDLLQDQNNMISTQIEYMGQYTRGSANGSSQAGSLDGTVCSGEFYIDGDGARLPKYKRRCKAWSKSSDQTVNLLKSQNDRQNLSLGFPNIDHIQIDSLSDELHPRKDIDGSTYDQMLHNFHQACCPTDTSLFSRFDSDLFPPLNAITEFIRLYFDSFQPVYPLFHVATFDPNKCHWILTLALAAMGCHFAEFAESEKCSTAMHEFLRRAIFVERERSVATATPLWLLQATLLSSIGMLHSGNETLKMSASKSFMDLVSMCNRERLLHPLRPEGNGILRDRLTDWGTWIEDESRRRTGYCIWLIDCTLVYHFDSKSLMSLEDAQAPLPCEDNLWQAESEDRWHHLYSGRSESLSLYAAIQILYVEKKLVPDIGEFSHILLLHGIYQRTWEVAEYFRRPLSNWTPSARKQARDSVVPNGSVWLPGIPAYSKWRNSACDCLDVLHWTANGTIAKAAGLEHPTILHLHAGRIVLLAPYREMRTMATSLARNTVTWGEHETCVEWQHIWRWCKHDQHKARLAIIHAGTLLWHVRRYSTNAFHEPVAVFLATLTLWAYGHCTRTLRERGDTINNKKPESDPSAPPPPDPTFVHLDRPCDDELVQLFVREGHTMQGNVTGVGDICGPNGPERMLKVGANILAGLMNWGISSDLNIILTRLGDQMSASPGSIQSNNEL